MDNARLRMEPSCVSVRLKALERWRKRLPPCVMPNRSQPEKEKGQRKKRGAEHCRSPKWSELVRIGRHVLVRCPESAYEQSGERIDYTREVIELRPRQALWVIERQSVKRYYPCCGKRRSPQ